MARDFRQGGFINATADTAEDADPRIGLVNLADVMLVFACGLMLALVSYWNLDVTSLQEMVQTKDVTEITDVETMQDATKGAGKGFSELGTVYQDPMTGKLYMITDEFDAAAQSAADDPAQTSVPEEKAVEDEHQ